MIRFSVPDMNCGHCTASIEKAIVTIDPHATVTCDLTARSVEVDSALDESALKKNILKHPGLREWFPLLARRMATICRSRR